MNLFATAAAGVALPAAALRSSPSAAAKAPEPIFALIDAHKQATKDLDAHCRREEQLADIPAAKSKSSSFGRELDIVKTDDPRWIAYTKEWVELSQKTDEIAGELVSVDNLSLAGAAALLAYAIEHAEAGYLWPDSLQDASDDAESGDFFYYLHRILLEALQRATIQA
ncbi:hypothetical protein [Bradyrhizobium sp. URHD0069]|uniref:hypothetical protein n=1 Tax=Bradyrhizobium sp. URHD0069 TaxID=1380355 RepID=UPI0004979E5B|nr:hypothetical protein [Bradyrhizobium sp. URHD0069]